MAGEGGSGLDDLYRVNRPDVDYIVIEYKFVCDPAKSGASGLGSTADGSQGSLSWLTGSNRIGSAVNNDSTAKSIRNAIKNDRIETWVVRTVADGSTEIQVLDAFGKAKAIDTSKIISPGTNSFGVKK